jgi:hypothetical protein
MGKDLGRRSHLCADTVGVAYLLASAWFGREVEQRRVKERRDLVEE